MKKLTEQKLKSKTIQVIGSDKISDLMNRLKQSNESYIVSTSPYSVKIHLPEHKLRYVCTESFMALKNWGILSSIKSHILKQHEISPLPIVYPRGIQYFDYSEKMDCSHIPLHDTVKFENICEMDISAAYVNAALITGIITKENHQKLISGPKQNRLKILGALASQKTEEYYIGPDLVEILPLNVNHITRNAWFNIVHYTDIAISNAYQLLKNEALFYYVDNLYFFDKPGLKREIEIEFARYEFKTKTIKLENFFLYHSRQGPVCVVKRAHEKKPKLFFIPKQKKTQYEFTK